MTAALSPAERELLAIYTRQAYDAYLSENLRDAQVHISQIEALNPGDIHARFLKGAVLGRQARPGAEMGKIRSAVELWRPLAEQLEGEAKTAMKDAIAEALSTILYIPVDLVSRQWDTYCDRRTATAIADTVRTLLEQEDSYGSRETDAYARWIQQCYRENYVFLVDEITGSNKPIPVGAPPAVAEAFEAALTEVARMAERIPGSGESECAVKRNAADKLQRFREHNAASVRAGKPADRK